MYRVSLPHIAMIRHFVNSDRLCNTSTDQPLSVRTEQTAIVCSPCVQMSSRVCTFHTSSTNSVERRMSMTSFHLVFITDWIVTVGDRAFPVAAARVWNSLPQHVTSAPSVAVFQSHLKTYPFSISYPTSSLCSVCTFVTLDTIIARLT